MKEIRSKLAEFLATGFYLGFLPSKVSGRPRASGGGALGTLLGLLLTPLLPGGALTFSLFLAAAAALAVLSAHRFCADTGIRDDQRVILDETVGYWTAIAFLPRGYAALFLAFVLFRVFDGLKPWPIRKVDESLHGGLGVVADDLLAGAAANIVLRLLLTFFPGA